MPWSTSILGRPDINNAMRLYSKTALGMSGGGSLLNHIAVDVGFKFSSGVKHPCIPTRVDDDVEAYSREGRSAITGRENLVAKPTGCHLFVRSGVAVPFCQGIRR